MVIALLAVVGLFFDGKIRAGISIANMVLGALTIAVPTMLIGVCKGAMMHCHMVTMPVLIVLGALLIAVSAFAAYLDAKPSKRA